MIISNDKSIKAFNGGSFYDFGRGGIYYKDSVALKRARPDLKDYIPSISMSANTASLIERNKQVTQQVKEAKENPAAAAKLASDYVPFFDISICSSNIGVKSGKLAIFMWSPTAHGATRGVHYSLGQWRLDAPNSKWMSFEGTDSKSFEARVTNGNVVFATFGMGDFLQMKSTHLNFIAFAGDSSIKNNHYAELIKSKIGNCLVLVIGDNDVSGQKTIAGFQALGLNAVLFKWSPSAPAKADVRDIAKVIKAQGGTIHDLEAYLMSKAVS